MTARDSETEDLQSFTRAQLETMVSALWEVIDLADAAELLLDYAPGLPKAKGEGNPVVPLRGVLRGIRRAADSVLGELVERVI